MVFLSNVPFIYNKHFQLCVPNVMTMHKRKCYSNFKATAGVGYLWTVGQARMFIYR